MNRKTLVGRVVRGCNPLPVGVELSKPIGGFCYRPVSTIVRTRSLGVMQLDMRELVIDSIRISQMNYQRVVVLKELETNLFLLIWIGPTEAEAIAVKMQGMTVPRPLTHDLLVDLVKSVGGSFEHILVNDLENETFYAKVLSESATRPTKLTPGPATPWPWPCAPKFPSTLPMQ